MNKLNYSSTVNKLATSLMIVASTLSTTLNAQTDYEKIVSENKATVENMNKELSTLDWIGLYEYFASDWIIRWQDTKLADDVMYVWNIEFLKVLLDKWYVCEWGENIELIVNSLWRNAYADMKDIVFDSWDVLTAKLWHNSIIVLRGNEQVGYIVANKLVMKDVTWLDIDYYKRDDASID